MSGAVGGFTSFLKLDSSQGFDKGVKDVESLTTALQKLKAEAGSLGSMKLKITIDNGTGDELKKLQEEANKKKKFGPDKQQILRSYKNEGELFKEKKQEDVEKEKRKKDRDNLTRAITKETVDTLNFFATTLKWTAGVVLGFGSALAAITLKNSAENTQNRTNASGFAMSPIDLYKLNKTGALFGGGDSSFNQLLTSGRKMFTDVYTAGNVDDPTLVAIKQAFPKIDPSKLVNMKPQEFSETIFNSTLSRLKEARKMESSFNASEREEGKKIRLIASSVGEMLGGPEFMSVVVGALNSKLGSVNNLQDAMKIFGSGQLVTAEGLDKSAEFGQVSGQTISLLQQQYEQFMINLETALIPSLRVLNKWLTDNKDNLANTVSNFIGFTVSNFIGFIGSVIQFIDGAVSLDLGKMLSASKNINTFRDEAIYSKENLEKGSLLGIVEKKDGEWSVNQAALSSNKIDHPELFKGISPVSKEGLVIVNKNIQGMLDLARSELNPKSKDFDSAVIGIRNAVDSGGGNLDQVKNNLIEWLKNNSQVLKRKDTPDQVQKDVKDFKFNMSNSSQGQDSMEIVLNAVFNIDQSQGRIYQTIRAQSEKAIDKFRGYVPMGQAFV